MKPSDITGLGGASRVITAASPVRASEPVRTVRPRIETGGADALSMQSAGEDAPVDAERVDTIRNAIEEGRYPVLPARVADAMIAAGYLLRIK